jgi:RNA polymerase sigma-70 factor, ECF subfamily
MDAVINIAHIKPGGPLLMQNWDDAQPSRGLRELDPKALGAVYDLYADVVYRYVRYRLNDDGAAEDIAGDVFLNLLEALQRGRGPETNVKAWLLGTAAHMVTDHLRRSYRRPTESMPDDLRDPGVTPHDEFERREQSRLFQSAFSQLTDEQQHVVTLRFGEGLSLEETAAIMKKNVNAIKALQFRAMAALQRNIEKAPHD